MSRLIKSLHEDENIIKKAHISWLTLVARMIIVAIIIGVLLALYFFVLKEFVDNLSELVKIIVIAVGASIAGLIFLVQIYKILTTKIILTTTKIVISKGFFINQVAEMSLSKIDNLKIKQPILARIFGYGSLSIYSLTSVYCFKTIANVYNFKSQVMNAVVDMSHKEMTYLSKEISKAMQEDLLI